MMRAALIRRLRPLFPTHPHLKKALIRADAASKLIRHTAAALVPSIIRPAPERLTVAITAKCNLACAGCRYGRDYMPNKQLPRDVVCDLLSDAAALGFPYVRLYGGEPLLHRDLAYFVEHAFRTGIKPVITTNGILLREQMPTLYAAGLRLITIGYYGFGQDYDRYVSRNGMFSRFERSIASVRDRYGTDVDLQINFLLTRQTCSIPLLRQAWSFARQYRLYFQVDLVHYSLPYFSEGPDRSLQFTAADRDRLIALSDELLRIKAQEPELFPESAASIRSIPDWALKGPAMEVPCDAYKMFWVGADGSVRLCYAAFPLGNLHETRLRDIFAGPEHREACRKAFRLDCPHCHCERGSRIDSHLPSLFRYRGGAAAPPQDDLEHTGTSTGILPILQ